MYFQIRELILWPKIGDDIRRLKFKLGTVNVISGASKTGKSAVIPIIDYCLASDKCAIPVGVIRESCSWFGIIIETSEGQKLLARREPGDQQQTSDMYVDQALVVEPPRRIDGRNSNTLAAKQLLDRIAGLSNLGFDPESDSPYKARPSFRDLMAFTFQPQNIIANPDVMFFKAETTEHREKLKTIFPYVLGAVTSDVLVARWEADRLGRVLRRKEQEYQALRAATVRWRAEALAWIRQAGDLGLLDDSFQMPGDWNTALDILRSVSEKTFRLARPSVGAIEGSLEILSELRGREAAAASILSEQRQRLNELYRLRESSAEYGSASVIQRDRLDLSKWLRNLADASNEPIVALGSAGRDELDMLYSALQDVEAQLRSRPLILDALDREMVRLRAVAEQSIDRLALVRGQITALERDSKQAQEASYRADRIERFLGRLEQALDTYDAADPNAEILDEINDLKGQIEELREKFSDEEVRRKTDNAKRAVELHAARIIPKLDAEWPNAPIKLQIDDLTVKVLRGSRDDYLWEIGSGANWLAYHVALTLALQKLFLEQPNHPVPGFVVYDQPSQVYFPRRAAHPDDEGEIDWRDEDVVAVRRVFKALADEAAAADGRLQVIVLDHAFEDVWGDLPGVELIAEWRGDKLVPPSWLAGDEFG